MIEKISRDICLIKYRNFPLSEFEKVSDEKNCYHPKIHSLYWLKSEENLIKEIVLLIRKLNINKLIFLSEMNKPWISKFTESRKDFKPLIKAIEYFKSHKIEKKFNGGVKVESKEFEKFLQNFYVITKCDGGFFDYNFMNENEDYIFYIHYSGELKVLTLNEKSNVNFIKFVNETNLLIKPDSADL